ncbi:uncharacterized protein DUF4252 [Ulvibacter sp. MAR_2010_11]|uniref:DUF4252 domain-containing protein n=1 Tax=Ulvibacter sp. MAR_2010_11 TaxID=1250229 RepID=UPI000C2BC0C2|nr:DUF4252 domain-containing protein [Ulvibacter sp. MAR_2010_11]PKA83950.1 uncharacterized protein DUF4252 [Ulvibacter sp. MAR_2010_11]
MVLFKFIIGLGIMALALFGCNSEESLQRYLVDKQEDNNFVKVDLATSLLQSENAQFTKEERDILNTVKKINVVAYPVKQGNMVEYEAEKAKLNTIIAQEQYKTLIKYGSNNKGATLKYLGEEDAIDELIVFASDDERGFAIFRLLGDNMRPDSMLKLMNSINSGDIDASKLKSIGELFGTKGDSI